MLKNNIVKINAFIESFKNHGTIILPINPYFIVLKILRNCLCGFWSISCAPNRNFCCRPLQLLLVVIYPLLGNSRLFFQKRHNKNVPYLDYRVHFFKVDAIYDKLRWVSSGNNLWNWRWMASIMKINDHEFLL